TNLEAANLHGLATGTGGLVVRVLPDQAVPAQTVTNTVKKLNDAIKAPILYTTKFQIPAATEFYPTKLPPIRGDSPTLVVGKMKQAAKLDYSIEGTLLGKKVTIPASEVVPAAEIDNFFLVGMVEQWKAANNKEAASPFRADRALAM